ncbi:uncharacterized protein VP01_102g5 [Puccinia sorghi]|uniref:Nucleoporin POM34 n=1 Tax=Puccinia sorghi TaxID=27349 RepID=A0A0L6VUV7_9BASI|nr:uncharacterized protein VP01_102g5 [Puccinia sorghi]
MGPSSIDSPLKRFSQQELPNKSVHFSTPILRPQRLFESTTPGNSLPLTFDTSTPNDKIIYPSSKLRTPNTPNPPENQINWIQELVDQPNKPINHQPSIPFNHFSKSINTTSGTTTPQKNLNQSLKNQLQTPLIKSSSSAIPATPSNPQQQQLNLRNQSSRIPISLNPLLNSGLKLGQKRLIERIRINLISLIVVWMVTSTRIYNEIILTLSSRIPFLSVPLQTIEWLLLVLLIGNLMEGYYRLKTQAPVTHVDLPLTPQQIRGAVQTSKNGLSSSIGSNLSPFRRTTHSPLSARMLRASTMYSPSDRSRAGNEVLSQDPTVNPLSRSTAHLFKSSIRHSQSSSSSAHQAQIPDWHHHSIRSPAFASDPAHHFLSRSVRTVSNQSSLQKLLDESLASS